MQEAAIKCSKITKTFLSDGLETPALRGVDLDIHHGEFFMIVGPSGCGKTTLISIIAGVLKQDFGQRIINQFEYESHTESECLDFRAKNIGFIFQSFNLIPTLNVQENVSIPLIINGMQKEQAIERSKAILDLVGLGERGESRPTKLSGGQQQRVAIARSLVHNPSVIICDEPTSALDHETGQKILDLMKDINKKYHTTFVIVTHDSRIFKYADRIAFMDDGKISSIKEYV